MLLISTHLRAFLSNRLFSTIILIYSSKDTDFWTLALFTDEKVPSCFEQNLFRDNISVCGLTQLFVMLI